jgi:cytidine deaminase
LDGLEDLRKAAMGALPSSWCPYSRFRVSAALEDSSGRIFTGVNVENASYGLTICAERAAVSAAVTAGSREFSRILVYSPDGEAMPCGACRQVLAEFCGMDFGVFVASAGGIREFRLGELLPHSFTLPGDSGAP